MRPETCKEVEMKKEDLKLRRCLKGEIASHLRKAIHDGGMAPPTVQFVTSDCIAKHVPEDVIGKEIKEVEDAIDQLSAEIRALENMAVVETKDDKKKPEQSGQKAKPGQVVKQKGPRVLPRGPKSQIQSAG